jgi:uncharacterized protein
MMQQFLIALGLLLVFEGLLYAFLPGHLRKMAEALNAMTNEQLRFGGTVAIAIGVFVIWLVRVFLP